ncbi:GH25 family lysozyme [Streptomyces celluloflavus]|uniref:GH25 family lysozyme n=1 Tax=Streptomyces celluloflavus TaxID=58344 RepID=A0ABW7RMG6_9ACTN|nr:GH25 family lysozyme [Streptomyces celluloflavus]
MTVKGIDVSSYQSSAFSTSGLDFVFVKATEGTSYINPKMRDQAAHARAAGLVVGFYHFLRPGDMAAQARYFVECCASVEGDPLFADWEDPGVTCAQKDAFLAEVKHLRGATHRVGLYCNQSYWLTRDTTSNAGDALWIADYVTAGKPRIKAAWTFHQYADRPLDTNLGSFADRAALRKWAGSSAPASNPEPKPTYAPFPGASFFKTGRHSALITAMGRRLAAEGCSAYAVGPGPDWSDADRASYAKWQKKLGYTGHEADGIPGAKSWAALKVPRV